MYLMESAPGARTIFNRKEVDYFCGTGYYGLQGDQEIINAACEAAQKYGIGSATSRLGFGNNPVLIEVEERAAEFFETESALYYVSGYLGNSILLQGLRDKYDIIFVDGESHYSVIDGASMAQKPVVTFAHMDASDLRSRLREKLIPGKRPLVICDGIFPVSGDISPLPDYVKVLEEFEPSMICIDDAHATAVIGLKGQGTLEYFGLRARNFYSSGTLSKAVGGHGGIIAGEKEFIERLRRLSNIPYSSSAVPTPAAAATAKALQILSTRPELRRKLWDNVLYAKKALRKLGFQTNDTPVPIICLKVKNADMKVLQEELFSKGIAVLYVPPGAYSSVPETGALRIAIFSTHTREQINRLIDEIKRLI